MAVPDVVVTGDRPAAARKLAHELTGVLQASVDMARSLELVPPKSYLAPEKEQWTAPKYVNWVNVGASGLIRGAVELGKGGEAKLVLRFFDVVSQREAMTKTCEKKNADIANCAHAFLDELIKLLTGEPGIFSSSIAFVRRTKKGKAVFTSDFDGRHVKRITDRDALSLLPAWDPSGKYLLFTSYLKANPDLFRYEIASGTLDWLSNRRGLNTGAAVSPDGRRIALTLSIDGNTEIYVMDWDGKNLKRLTDSWGQDVSPAWSPDGKSLAFVSSRSGNPHIYLMGADGSNPRRLTFRGNYNQEPDWSPRADGQIAFTARDERLQYDIFLVDPATGDISRLTQDQGNNESPSHSPDGHHLVFTSTRSPGSGKKLYVMDIDGTNQRKLDRIRGEVETPVWGPRVSYD
jgi:TolB protein